jgi:carbon monoxide dehydrogenase subunit G
VIVLAILLLSGNASFFTVAASASASYDVAIPREALRGYADDIGLLARHMPGVVSVTPRGDGTYLYRTSKEIPLSSPLETDFVIRKDQVGDSLTVYRSVDDGDLNYMSCRVLIRPRDAATTTIEIQLQIRLSRERAAEVHWLAPVLGESFISREMTKDMDEMLQEFIEKSSEELYARLRPVAGND